MSWIKTSASRRLWEDAQASLEYSSTRFWEYMFKEVLFNGPYWHNPSQQAYTPRTGERRRCDSFIERYDNLEKKWETIMFHEAKLDSASAAEITLCEKQVYNACAAFLDYFPERDSVFALTTWGTKGRLWVVNRGTKHLIPRFLGPEVFSAHYIEASSTAAMYLKKSLRSLHNWKDSSSDTKARDRARTEGGETEGEWPEGEWPGGGWLEGARSIGARSEGAGPEGVEPGGAGPCRPATSYQGQGSRESTVDYSQKTNSSVGQVAPAFVGTWYYEEKKNHVYYKFRIPDSGKEIKTKASQWKAAYQEGIPCLMYTREETGRQYYVWELGAIKAPITRGYR